MYHRFTIAIFLGCSISMPGFCEEPGKKPVTETDSTISAQEIAKKMYDRDDGVSQISLQKLSSCRYAMKNSRKGCTEKPRSNVIESVRRDYGDKQKDVKTVSIVKSPTAERGVGFLQYDYENSDKDADQWMYLSALGKVKRIVSGNDNEPKQGSFFGSEFSYEDLEQRHLEDYTYEVLKSVTYKDRPCWVLEITPTKEHARKSNYQKSINWIDKERHIALKTILYDRQGKKVKQLISHDLRNIDGVWVPMILNMDNVQTNRMTTLKIEKTALNINVQDDFLTLRTLTDGAFREQHLNKYRAFIEQ